jgi:hypothetical protein
VLALSVAAVVRGAESLTAISQWGREQSVELLQRIGFRHWPGPCVATLHRIFRDLDVTALETVLTQWWQSWLATGGGLALDGKTLRGSESAEQPAVQLLVAFGHRLNVALAQQDIRQHHENGAARALLSQLDLTGWIVTGDAKFTQKGLAEQIVAAGGDYVMIVKEKAGRRQEWVLLAFAAVTAVIVANAFGLRLALGGLHDRDDGQLQPRQTLDARIIGPEMELVLGRFTAERRRHSAEHALGGRGGVLVWHADSLLAGLPGGGRELPPACKKGPPPSAEVRPFHNNCTPDSSRLENKKPATLKASLLRG